MHHDAVMEQHEVRSIITCDLEGRIETYNEGAERLFGYKRQEVIGHKRVSLFSPGKVVLGHVGKWLEKARREGAFQTNTVFLRKDGTRFAARIRITPTYRRRDGRKRHIGYCGLTTALPDVSPDRVMPRTSLATRVLTWVIITRAPFLTATLMPILMAAAWVGANSFGESSPWILFASALIGAASLHIAANTFNDYFDWRSGTDPANNDYFVPYSGGSRAIELGLISERKLLWVAIIALISAVPADHAAAPVSRGERVRPPAPGIRARVPVSFDRRAAHAGGELRGAAVRLRELTAPGRRLGLQCRRGAVP